MTGYEAPAGFTCPQCAATSYHPRDVAEGYCAMCHDWTRDRDWPSALQRVWPHALVVRVTNDDVQQPRADRPDPKDPR